MGEMEKKSRKRLKKKNLKKLILNTVAGAGVLGMAVVAPQALGAMAKLGMLPAKRQRESINAARDRLLKQKLLARDSNGMLRITNLGERELQKIEALQGRLPKPKKWDGRWRILSFDIPNRREPARFKIRHSLQTAGFILLQRSVWIYPYDCEDFIALLKAELKIGKDMLYIIADTIEGDAAYRKHFNLKG